MTWLLFNSLVFILIFLIICNWFQLLRFLSIIIGPKYRTSSVDDKWIKSIVKKKTGLSLLDITIFHDQKMYGMMVGFPFWPKMILSEGLYKSFNKDELEWVILHEAGHCVLWHNLQAFLIELLILGLGVYGINVFRLPLILSLLLAIILSMICIQLIRWGIEYIADLYSINRVTNLKGVITAQDKLRKANGEKGILILLFRWNISPTKRIEMAKQRMRKF